MAKVGTIEWLRKISVSFLESRISWICIYYTRVVNQSYYHYMEVIVTRPMMDMV
jgi:hypothetical protein